FKKSFRDEKLIAQTAIVDPSLLASCPRGLMAAQGMDAFTQLLESHVALNANPLTDTLVVAGIRAFNAGFFEALDERTSASLCHMAYASFTSGVTLANAGLGVVHGLASPLGAFFPIPHGVVCGTLLAESVDINIAALTARNPDSKTLRRYAAVGEILGSNMTLVDRLREWIEQLGLPRLGDFGVTERDLDRIVTNCRGGSMKGNPIVLEDDELAEILRRRL
ncbi:MAG: iron-containing alcohol dehydrogenase, partial [Verrucomicrobia bacterium]|nr:iron-containing alcohol dehydrogenase [Verrucomicrobiota bacterium]